MPRTTATPFNFGGFETTNQFPSQVRPEDEEAQWVGPIPQLHALRDEIAQVREEKLALRMQLTEARAELVQAERKKTSAITAEEVARGVIATLRRQVFDLHYKANKNMVDYDRGVQLEEEVKQKQQLLDQQRQILFELQNEHNNATAHLREQETQVAIKDQELASLRESLEKLRQTVEQEQQVNANLVSELQQAHETVHRAENAYQMVVKARDEALQHQHNIHAEFQALRQHLDQAQQHIALLEQQQQEAQAFVSAYQSLEREMENARVALEDRDRTLIVKDERITQLETQYQKERQRNLHVAEAAAARTATASPADEPPEPFALIADSLEQELNAASDYGESIYEHLEFSGITHVIHIEPVVPDSRSLHTLHISEAASTAPATVPAPTFTASFCETANIAPVVRRITNATASTQTDLPEHIAIIQEVVSISPVQQPIASVTTASTQTASPEHVTCIQEAVSISPIQQQVASVATASTQTDLSAFTIQTLQPVTGPTPAPVASVNKVASVSPIQSSNTNATASTQTHPPKLAIQMLEKPVLEVIPIPPVEVASIHTTTQTDAPKLTMSIVDAAVIDIMPTDEWEILSIPTTDVVIIPDQKKELAPIKVIFEQKPAMQTAEPIPKDHVTAPPVRNNVIASRAVLPIIAGFLTLLCFCLYIELTAWRTANGAGFGDGYGTVHDRGGAFGNGRYVLGIPLAMDIGHSDLSENIARTMSIAITQFEDWAGISQRVLY